jgi:hypothetical protein
VHWSITIAKELSKRILVLAVIVMCFNLLDDDVLLADFLAFGKDVHPISPGAFVQESLILGLVCVAYLELKCFVSNIHDEVNHLRSYLDIDSSLLCLLFASCFLNKLLLLVMLGNSLSFHSFCFFLHSLGNHNVPLDLLLLDLFGLSYFVLNLDFPTLIVSPSDVCLLLLFMLFLQELLDQLLFSLLLIKRLLDLSLVDHHLAVSPFSLFASELVVVLGLFDLVHGCSVREVLELTRWNSFLLFLTRHSLLYCDVFLDSELSQVFLELFNSLDHVVGVVYKLSVE